MSHGAPVIPFSMPMFRDFVPEKLRPWIYVFIVLTFQFSGGIYLGSLNQMMGSTALMREDLVMCMFANLAGMAIHFPNLFRMKFRFTNKTLLTTAAIGVLVCNLLAPHITFLPLLWLVCFIEGICKIQGTFECMSNIQLWITPKREMTAFFPVLHIVIIGSMQLSDLLATWLMYRFHWVYMHWFIAGAMLVDLLILRTCIRHFRMFKKLPLFGIDWLGALLWALLLLEIAFFFNYGDWYDWFNSPVMRQMAFCVIATLIAAVWRMLHIRHPYLEPKMWTYPKLVPLFLLITLTEAFFAAEHVLEEIFYEEVMHYPDMVRVQVNWAVAAGGVFGCLFAYWWMHLRRYNYLRLLIIGMAGMVGYFAGFYFTMSADIHLSQLFLPVACRGFAYAVLSATLMACLHQLLTFQHFFQALGVFNMLHMVMGGVIGSAIYTRAISYYTPEGFARYGSAVDPVAFSQSPFDLGHYMESFVSRVMEVGVRTTYGWLLYASIFLLLLYMLYDTPIRRDRQYRLKLLPTWRRVRRTVSQDMETED